MEAQRSGPPHLVERLRSRLEAIPGVVRATLDALGRIVPELPPVQLVGVRTVRVFDRDLVVVLLRQSGAGERSLVGTGLEAGDRALYAARAVLNALNRTLGNYLSVGD